MTITQAINRLAFIAALLLVAPGAYALTAVEAKGIAIGEGDPLQQEPERRRIGHLREPSARSVPEGESNRGRRLLLLGDARVRRGDAHAIDLRPREAAHLRPAGGWIPSLRR